MIDLRCTRLPNPAAILSQAELSVFELTQFQDHVAARQRQGWLAARWLVKRVLWEQMPITLRSTLQKYDVSILSIDSTGRAVRPQIVCAGQPSTRDVSIAHTHRGVLVAVARDRGIRVGVDLVDPCRVPLTRLDMWFTPREQQWIVRQPVSAAAAKLWAVKQAYYKATNRGESFVPRRYEVTMTGQKFQCQTPGRRRPAAAHIAVTPCDEQIAAIVARIMDRRLVPQNILEQDVISASDLLRAAS